jgi:hypothetical protein
MAANRAFSPGATELANRFISRQYCRWIIGALMLQTAYNHVRGRVCMNFSIAIARALVTIEVHCVNPGVGSVSTEGCSLKGLGVFWSPMQAVGVIFIS